MSGHPQGHYDEGYDHHQPANTDSYYQDEHNQQYYDNQGGYAEHGQPAHAGHQQGADGYYDES